MNCSSFDANMVKETHAEWLLESYSHKQHMHIKNIERYHKKDADSRVLVIDQLSSVCKLSKSGLGDASGNKLLSKELLGTNIKSQAWGNTKNPA